MAPLSQSWTYWLVVSSTFSSHDVAADEEYAGEGEHPHG
jgi:hypothetical protein